MPKTQSSIFTPIARRYFAKSGITINGDKPWDIQVHNTTVYMDTIINGTLGFGDGYSKGYWDVEQLDVFFEKILAHKQTQKHAFRSIGGYFTSIRNKIYNTQIGKRAFHVGEKHYDLGNEMYEYMLGPSMGYSCGLYLKATDDLTTAQYNKFDALCKALQLKKGMKILEIGCGWGTFAKYAIEKYGVSVVGLTVSKEQKAYAEKVCEGLDATFVLRDYMTIGDKYDEQFDRVVSIEMIEAVGRKNFRAYFSFIERVLKPEGLAGIQAIVGTGGVDPFLSTRIFPNGLVPSELDITKNIDGLLRFKKWSSFGTDYDKTLMDWDKNFRKHWPKIKKLTDKDGNKLYDEQFYRMWRYYLLCCAGSFRVGMNDDAHIILSKISADSPLK